MKRPEKFEKNILLLCFDVILKLISKKVGEFLKICGLLTISELYLTVLDLDQIFISTILTALKQN